MTKFLILITLLLLVLVSPVGVSYSRDEKEKGDDKGKKAKLVITAYPRQGFRPLHISFNAKLENVSENDAEYYCLQEEWDFGDGAVSSEQPHCEEFGDGTSVNINFFAEHIYEDPGSFTVRFKLGDPQKVRSNNLSVLVLDRETGR